MIKDAVFQKYLADKKMEFNETIQKLISEDAPKNKFSIVTGKLKMIEDFELDFQNLVKQSQES